MPLIVPSFAMPSRLLGTPTVLNQMRFGGNFFFWGKICQYHRKRVRDLQNSFLFAFRVLLKYIHNLEIKMFFQNSGNSFTLYCLIYAWLKFYVNIMRFSKAATQRGSLVKVF